MPETTTLKSKLESKLTYHRNEVARITKMLDAIVEAEHYLEEPVQANLVLTPPVAEVPATKADRDRIREALARMPETFTSSDLFKSANSDGQGPIIPRSTLAPFFSLLKKKGQVVEVQAPKGNTPGIYKRTV